MKTPSQLLERLRDIAGLEHDFPHLVALLEGDATGVTPENVADWVTRIRNTWAAAGVPGHENPPAIIEPDPALADEPVPAPVEHVTADPVFETAAEPESVAEVAVDPVFASRRKQRIWVLPR